MATSWTRPVTPGSRPASAGRPDAESGTRDSHVISARGQVAAFEVMRVFAAAAHRRAGGAPVFDLTAGQPASHAPAAVRAAAHEALDNQHLGYTMAMGIAPLRQAIARHYARRYDLQVDPDHIVVTTGSSGAFLLAFLAAFDAGDVVALARPGYPAYRNMLAALGCEVVDLPCDESTRFQPTVQMLEQLSPRPAGVVIASPANPTGTVLDAGELGRIATWCANNGVRLISDEIYHGIEYAEPGENVLGSGRATCAWSTDRQSVVVNSFSKYYAMTGWRLGWMLTPPELLDSVDRLAGNFSLCPPTLAQHAAVHAFDDYQELDAKVAVYSQSRTLLLDGLQGLGLTRYAPVDGAFYVYVDVRAYCTDSIEFVYRMLAETGVAAAPGVDFDPVEGHRHIRISFAGGPDVISGALTALRDWLPRQRI